MTLEKAIEILQEIKRTSDFMSYPDDLDAIQLGISALLRIHAMRKDHWFPDTSRLPSETTGI